MSGLIPLAAGLNGDSTYVSTYFLSSNNISGEISLRNQLNKVSDGNDSLETERKETKSKFLNRIQQEFFYLSEYIDNDCIQIIQSYQSNNLAELFQDLVSLALEAGSLNSEMVKRFAQPVKPEYHPIIKLLSLPEDYLQYLFTYSDGDSVRMNGISDFTLIPAFPALYHSSQSTSYSEPPLSAAYPNLPNRPVTLFYYGRYGNIDTSLNHYSNHVLPTPQLYFSYDLGYRDIVMIVHKETGFIFSWHRNCSGREKPFIIRFLGFQHMLECYLEKMQVLMARFKYLKQLHTSGDKVNTEPPPLGQFHTYRLKQQAASLKKEDTSSEFASKLAFWEKSVIETKFKVFFPSTISPLEFFDAWSNSIRYNVNPHKEKIIEIVKYLGQNHYGQIFLKLHPLALTEPWKQASSFISNTLASRAAAFSLR